jgi:uncharacterized glyoxalase superfamily protein PhnB
MFRRAIPVVHVTSSVVAARFYCAGLGFHEEFAYRPDETRSDPCYFGVSRDGVIVHVSSFPGDGKSGAVLNITVEDLDALHTELLARSVPIDLPPTTQTWGEREMHVKDPDSNCIRFVSSRNAATVGSSAPFLIVRAVGASLSFYRDLLGFELQHATPDDEPFFAVLARGGARLMVKAILPDVAALPNHVRHPRAKWDVFVHAPNPDELATELIARGVTFRAPVADTEDGLRGFEVQDPDGYVIFFGRPR